MPSLNLRNALKRNPNRPTLKQRAAALKATAARVMGRRAPVPSPEIVTIPSGADPQLVALVAEWQDARRKLNDPDFPDGPEADAMGDRDAELQREIYLFPARTVADLVAKIPAFREEAEDALSGYAGQKPEETLPGAAWAGLLRDVAHLAGVAPTPQAKSDPIFAAIEANREAEALMDAFGREEDARSWATRATRQEALVAAQIGSWRAVFATRPNTQAGMRALADWIRWQLERHGEPMNGDGTVWADACLSLLALVENLSGPVLVAEVSNAWKA